MYVYHVSSLGLVNPAKATFEQMMPPHLIGPQDLTIHFQLLHHLSCNL
jgi:hypothetical protein